MPPPAAEIATCLGDLERYLNDAESMELPLVRVARAHAQFETIHPPYLDGNGRLGRLLVTLCLIAFGIIEAPLLGRIFEDVAYLDLLRDGTDPLPR